MLFYRGVNATHPAYPEAQLGNACPWGWDDPNGHSDVELHVMGNTRSIFLSWTWMKAVAIRFAEMNGVPGIVLCKEMDEGDVIFIEDYFGEYEVLCTGPITGASVLKPPTYEETKIP